MTLSNLPSPALQTSPRAWRSAGVALLLGAAAFGALAQYKIVGPDGRVTYTDRPPANGDGRPSGTSGGGSGSGGGGAGNGLPYETRQASARYPVALYAGKACDACDQARQWLRSHGLPFSEYSVSSNEDIAAFQQRFGGNVLPVVTFGSQTVKGFSANDFQSYADAAGYPRNARLTGYNWPAAMPLVPPRTAPSVSTTSTTAAPGAPAVTLPPPSRSGIQF